MSAPLFVALPGHQAMAERLVRKLGYELGNLGLRRFPDGESHLRYEVSPKGRSLAILCTLDRPDEKIMPLILAASTARDLGARRIGLIAPYLAYMRQDARFQEGEAVSAPVFARLLSTYFDWIVTVDPHLHRIAALSDIFSIPAAAVSAAPLLADWIRANVQRPLLVGPDSESRQWAAAMAQEANAPFLTLKKTRLGDRHVEIENADLTQWQSYKPVLVDDIISTAVTMSASVRELRASHLSAPVCLAVHGVFAGQAYEALSAAGAEQIVTTNTIEHPTNRVDLSGVLARAVRSFAN